MERNRGRPRNNFENKGACTVFGISRTILRIFVIYVFQLFQNWHCLINHKAKTIVILYANSLVGECKPAWVEGGRT